MASILDILDGLGYALDTPGALTRGLLAGRPGERVGGRELLEDWGVLGANTSGLDMGDVAGFGAELLLDPLNLATGGTLAGLKAANRGIGAANDASRTMRAAGALPEELLDDAIRVGDRHLLPGDKSLAGPEFSTAEVADIFRGGSTLDGPMQWVPKYEQLSGSRVAPGDLFEFSGDAAEQPGLSAWLEQEIKDAKLQNFQDALTVSPLPRRDLIPAGGGVVPASNPIAVTEVTPSSGFVDEQLIDTRQQFTPPVDDHAPEFVKRMDPGLRRPLTGLERDILGSDGYSISGSQVPWRRAEHGAAEALTHENIELATRRPGDAGETALNFLLPQYAGDAESLPVSTLGRIVSDFNANEAPHKFEDLLRHSGYGSMHTGDDILWTSDPARQIFSGDIAPRLRDPHRTSHLLAILATNNLGQLPYDLRGGN